MRSLEIFGHRGVGCSGVGGDSEFPENSIAGFERAVELGLDGVELDVWLTADDQVVVIHGGGSDLDGFLYETVVDVDASPLLRRTRSILSQASAESKSDSGDFKPPLDRSESGAISVDSALSTASSINDKLLASLHSTTTLRRIEEVSYVELRRAGHLRHRETFASFCKRTGAASRHGSTTSLQKAIVNNGGEGEAKEASSIHGVYTTFARPASSAGDEAASVPQEDGIPESSSSFIVSRILRRADLENNRLEYIESLLPHFQDQSSSPAVSEVPLLSEVFARFHERLTFNVELKGTRKSLGAHVLEVARPFPNVIARISSFLWRCRFGEDPHYVPTDAAAGTDIRDGLIVKEPGSFLCFRDEIKEEGQSKRREDLLLPLVNNPMGVPLALLFWQSLPSIKVILACLDDYSAEWAHVSEYCYFEQSPLAKRDLEKALSLRSAILADSRMGQLVHEAVRQGFSFRESDCQEDECQVPSHQEGLALQLIEDLCVLKYLGEELHKHQRKVLVYGRHAHESSELMELCVLCGIDGLCPNNAADAVSIRASIFHQL